MLQWSRRLLVGLNVLNWLVLVLFMAGLAAITAWPDILLGLIAKASPGVDAAHVLGLTQITLILCLPVAYSAHAIFTRLVAMIDAVGRGEAFAPDNARRLRIIGWWLLATQVIDAVYGWLSIELASTTGEYYGWSPSLTAWLAVLLLFVLARIFEQGAAMQQELDQTV